VFLETANTSAISEIDIPSDRRNRRISAQSSTLNTWLPPRLATSQGLGKLVNFQLPCTGQYSAAADTSYMAFDLLAIGGIDLRTQRWTVRRGRLEQLAARWVY
jgi:hypothetical protein